MIQYPQFQMAINNSVQNALVQFSAKESGTDSDEFFKSAVNPDYPLAFIHDLPPESNSLGRKWQFAKYAFSRELNDFGIKGRFRTAENYLSKCFLAKGMLNEFLKAELAQMDKKLEEDNLLYTLDTAYLELANKCLKMGADQVWANSASDQEIGWKVNGPVAELAIYTGPNTRTVKYYNALKNSQLDFNQIAQGLYEAGMSIFKPKGLPEGHFDINEAYQYKEKARIHQQFGHNDRAIAEYERGLSAYPDSFRIRDLLADLYHEEGQYKQELGQRQWLLDHALNDPEKEPGYVANRYCKLAIVQYELKDYDAAFKNTNEAIRLEPESKFYHSYDRQYGESYTDFLGKIVVAQQANQ